MTVLRLAAIVAAITACAAYPYLPGEYGPLAGPLSTMAQGGSAAALLLVPLGLAWLLFARRAGNRAGRSQGFSRAATIALSVPGLIVASVAWGAGGRALGLAVLSIAVTLLVVRRRAVSAAAATPVLSTTLPAAMVVVPLVAVLLQVLFVGPLRADARDRAMIHGGTRIDVLARYHAAHGRYPQSLTTAWPDGTWT